MYKKYIYYIISAVLFIVLWHILSLFTHPLVVSSPIDTAKALLNLLVSKEFNLAFLTTVKRVLSGVFIAGFIGFWLAIFAYLKEEIEHLLQPLRWVFMSISPVIVVIFAMLWFGLGSSMVIFIVSLILSPIVYINTIENLKAINKDFLEVARVYDFSFFMRLTRIYIPSILPSLSVSLIYLTSMGVRVSILAEVLGANDGIGYELSNSRINLEIDILFAWAVITLILVAFLEFILLGAIRKWVRY